MTPIVPSCAPRPRAARAARPGRALRRRALGAGCAAALLAVAACGVPAEGTTRTVPADKVPYRLLQSAPADAGPTPPAGQSITRPQVYFIDGSGALVPQRVSLPATGLEPVAAALLRALVRGPSDVQHATGLSSALGTQVRLRIDSIDEGTARIEVDTSESVLAADRLPLAVGQIVLTATSVDGIDRVQLVQDGQPVDAPLPGGEQTSRALTAADYASLLPADTSPRSQVPATATPPVPSPDS